MKDYRVELDIYHGPLDLLLYLIRRDEIDIHDIPIARITEQYLKFLETIERLDINLAGEFLVMAATLMEIKAAMLAPTESVDEDGEGLPAVEDPTDPRYELIQQLLEYKRFKDAAAQLDEKREMFNARFPRQAAPFQDDDPNAPQIELEDIQIWDLVEAFERIMETVGDGPGVHEVLDDDTPIELHVADIVDRLQRDGAMSLQQMFVGRTQRTEMIGLFLAMLELVRQRRLIVLQDGPGSEISLSLRSKEDIEAMRRAEVEADSRDAPSTKIPLDADAYAWSDKEIRERFVRRQEKRAAGQSIAEDEEFDQDVRAIEAEEGPADESPDDE